MLMWNQPASAFDLPKIDTQKDQYVIECCKDKSLAACIRGSHPEPPPRPSNANPNDPHVHSIIW